MYIYIYIERERERSQSTRGSNRRSRKPREDLCRVAKTSGYTEPGYQFFYLNFQTCSLLVPRIINDHSIKYWKLCSKFFQKQFQISYLNIFYFVCYHLPLEIVLKNEFNDILIHLFEEKLLLSNTLLRHILYIFTF